MSFIRSERPLAKQGKKPKAQRKNRAPHREAVMAARGERCRAAALGDCEGPIQAAHVWSSGTGGPDVVENALPLCRRHHTDKDGYRIKWDYAWFDADQIAWLASVGYVTWGSDGEPFGLGWRHFDPRPTNAAGTVDSKAPRL